MKRKLAVFTIAQDEPVFGPVWLEHYTDHVLPTDIYVLDHKLDDGNVSWVYNALGGLPDQVDALGVNVVPVHCAESFNHNWLRDTVQAFQRFLLHSYEWVLFAEIDELVIPFATRASSIREWLDFATSTDRTFKHEIFRANGFEVVHLPSEPDLDWAARPLLAHRHWWYRSKIYSKPVLSSVPMDWEIGFHDAAQAKECLSHLDLMLVHLHKIDFKTSLEKARRVAARRLSTVDHEKGWGFQNYETGEANLRWYFQKDIDTVRFPFDQSARDANLVPIPEAIRLAI